MAESEFEKQSREWKEYQSDLANGIDFNEFDTSIKMATELLDFLADSVSRMLIVNTADNGISILTSEFLFSTSKTLCNISSCCRYGCFADANMLVRKYRDDLFLYLFILEKHNNRGGLTKDEQDEAVNAWFNNSAINGKYLKQLDIKNYLRYLKSNSLVADCIRIHGFEKQWNSIGRKQNNYTHNNGYMFLTSNYLTFYNYEKSTSLLDQVNNDIVFITSFFLATLILVKANYISSYDYIEYLENAIQPPEGYQYMVAPIVQEYINTYVVKLHPNLKKYLIENNPYGMLIN